MNTSKNNKPNMKNNGDYDEENMNDKDRYLSNAMKSAVIKSRSNRSPSKDRKITFRSSSPKKASARKTSARKTPARKTPAKKSRSKSRSPSRSPSFEMYSSSSSPNGRYKSKPMQKSKSITSTRKRNEPIKRRTRSDPSDRFNKSKKNFSDVFLSKAKMKIIAKNSGINYLSADSYDPILNILYDDLNSILTNAFSYMNAAKRVTLKLEDLKETYNNFGKTKIFNTLAKSKDIVKETDKFIPKETLKRYSKNFLNDDRLYISNPFVIGLSILVTEMLGNIYDRGLEILKENKKKTLSAEMVYQI